MSDEGEGVTLPDGWVIDDQEIEWDYHQPPWDGVTTLLPAPESTGRFRLTIRGHREEAPPRSEYPLQTVKVAAGCPVVNDSGVVLVPAHSLRSGDEVEWAPGDWRAIERIWNPTVLDVSVKLDGGEGADLHRLELVAVRRSGVTG